MTAKPTTVALLPTSEANVGGYAAKLERPGGLVEVRQLAWLGESGRANKRLLGRTAHVERQAPTGQLVGRIKKTLLVGPV